MGKRDHAAAARSGSATQQSGVAAGRGRIHKDWSAEYVVIAFITNPKHVEKSTRPPPLNLGGTCAGGTNVTDRNQLTVTPSAAALNGVAALGDADAAPAVPGGVATVAGPAALEDAGPAVLEDAATLAGPAALKNAEPAMPEAGRDVASGPAAPEDAGSVPLEAFPSTEIKRAS